MTIREGVLCTTPKRVQFTLRLNNLNVILGKLVPDKMPLW